MNQKKNERGNGNLDHRPMQSNQFWNQKKKQQGGFRHIEITGLATTKPKLIENTKGKRWTEYCTELYNYKLKTHANILKNKDKENGET